MRKELFLFYFTCNKKCTSILVIKWSLSYRSKCRCCFCLFSCWSTGQLQRLETEAPGPNNDPSSKVTSIFSTFHLHNQIWANSACSAFFFYTPQSMTSGSGLLLITHVHYLEQAHTRPVKTGYFVSPPVQLYFPYYSKWPIKHYRHDSHPGLSKPVPEQHPWTPPHSLTK